MQINAKIFVSNFKNNNEKKKLGNISWILNVLFIVAFSAVICAIAIINDFFLRKSLY